MARISIETLASLFGLPSWDTVDEANESYIWDASDGIPDDDARCAAEDAARLVLYRRWVNAIETAASQEFDKHGIELHESKNRLGQYEIKPAVSWRHAANLIRETINGVGYFHFETLREALDSGPYTPRQFVLAHLGWMRHRAEVYGDRSAGSVYEDSFRS